MYTIDEPHLNANKQTNKQKKKERKEKERHEKEHTCTGKLAESTAIVAVIPASSGIATLGVTRRWYTPIFNGDVTPIPILSF